MPEEAEACMSAFLFCSSSPAPVADGSLKIGSALPLPFLLPDQRRPAAAKEETHHADAEQTCEGYFKPGQENKTVTDRHDTPTPPKPPSHPEWIFFSSDWAESDLLIDVFT